MPEPSIPALIGATENALRALLDKTLATTEIEGYPEWIVLNTLARAADAASGDWRIDSARALKRDVEPVEDVLRERGLIVGEAQLSERGATALDTARRAVGAATGSLTAGIDASDAAALRRVLGTLRARAESALDASRRIGA